MDSCADSSIAERCLLRPLDHLVTETENEQTTSTWIKCFASFFSVKVFFNYSYPTSCNNFEVILQTHCKYSYNVYEYQLKNLSHIHNSGTTTTFFMLWLEGTINRSVCPQDPWQGMTINKCIYHGCWVTHEFYIDRKPLSKVNMSLWIILYMWNPLHRKKKHEWREQNESLPWCSVGTCCMIYWQISRQTQMWYLRIMSADYWWSNAVCRCWLSVRRKANKCVWLASAGYSATLGQYLFLCLHLNIIITPTQWHYCYPAFYSTQTLWVSA